MAIMVLEWINLSYDLFGYQKHQQKIMVHFQLTFI